MNIARRRLKALCKGRSKVEVARLIGVSGPFLGDVLRGRKRPGPKILGYLGLEAFESYRPSRSPPPLPPTA